MSDAKEVVHLILLKVKETATDEQMKNFTDGAKSLVDIPGVLKVSTGKSFAESSMSHRR